MLSKTYPCIRSRAISILLANDPKLIDFVLNPSRNRLTASPQKLRRRIRSFSNDQKILVQIALDLWDGCGGVKLAHVVYALDHSRLECFIMAIEVLRFSHYQGSVINPDFFKIS